MRLRLFALVIAVSASTRAATVDQRVDALLAKMTLEEKIGQLIQYTDGQPDLTKLTTGGMVGCVFNMNGAAKTNELQRAAVQDSRLKIPLLFAHDVIHGYRTIFPIPLAIASSWDPSSAELAAHIAATEARSSGIRWTFAPMVDIARDPRWGRITEGAGEDPFLGSAFAAAYVRGFQGTDLTKSDSVLACAKHFAAYGGAEAGRDYNSVDMSERMLREVYLAPYKAAVDAGVATIMTAFNTLNGVPATANTHLLKTILRTDWKFRGFVDSDYQAIEQLVPHGVAANNAEAALKAIKAGVDMDMVDGSYLTLASAVKKGQLDGSVITAAARRILRAKFELGLFDNPYTDEQRESTVLLAKEHRDAARRVAQKSIVLLRNERGLLPLSKNVTLAVIGPLADSKADMLGSWHALGVADEAVSVLDGLRAKMPADHIVFAKSVDELQSADVILAVLGEQETMSGEANSRTSIDLPGTQQQLLESIVATGKPVVLLVLAGRPLTISWAASHVPAIVWGWFLGNEGGNAIADVLLGDSNPSGKLTISFPRVVGQIPIYYAHLPTGRPERAEEKYTSKYIDSPNDPLYPFGFGLSYTRFDYSGMKVTRGVNGSMVVSADVRNSGSRAGDEIVQVYVRKPVGNISRPVKELKGFRRVTLAPGQSQRVEIPIARNDLRSWTESGWTQDVGTFRVWIGSSSVEGLENSFDVK